MTKKTVLIIISAGLLLLLVGVGITYAISEKSNMFQAGKKYKDHYSPQEIQPEGSDQVLAVYKNMQFTKSDVEYFHDSYVLVNQEITAADSTDKEIIDRLIKGELWLEEAERLGFVATQEEIDAMVENAQLAYTIPEGKQMLDDYLAGAEMSFEEYLDALREQAPRTIARQKMKNEISRRYCEENGLTYTGNNVTTAMLEAQNEYIEQVFQQRKDQITYYLDTQ